MNAENADVCANEALFTVGAKRVPVGSFLATVIVAYTAPSLPELEAALNQACSRHGVTSFALVDLRRAIIAVMRDRGARVESGDTGTRFVWPSFDQPVRQRIFDGLRELAIHPGRWMTPDPAEPVDCEGDAADATIGLIDSLMDRIARLDQRLALRDQQAEQDVGVYDRMIDTLLDRIADLESKLPNECGAA